MSTCQFGHDMLFVLCSFLLLWIVCYRLGIYLSSKVTSGVREVGLDLSRIEISKIRLGIQVGLYVPV